MARKRKRKDNTQCHGGRKIRHQSMLTALWHCRQLTKDKPGTVYVMYDCEICGFGHVGRAPRDKLKYMPLKEDMESEAA